jgi:putative membrane protein
MMSYGGFGLLGGFGMLTMLLFWVGLIALVVWGVGALLTPGGETRDDNPLESLRRRYARGEIDEAEYEQARRRLG